jgi:hypothetical protein
MKRAICLLFLFVTLHFVNAQKPTFLRVYNAHGKKINKGTIFETTDTSITLTRKNIFTETPIVQIDVIKSKRTTGHRILITTLSVAGIAVLLAGAVHSLSRPHGYYRTNTGNQVKKDPMGLRSKPPRPLKKYQVSNDTNTWRKQRILLNQLLYY